MFYMTVWTFNTARFTVELGIAPEDMSPHGVFSEQDDVEFALEGGWHWFKARVQVLMDVAGSGERRLLGADYLGGCSYHSLEDFIRPGDYFRDMARKAIRNARDRMAHMILVGVS